MHIFPTKIFFFAIFLRKCLFAKKSQKTIAIFQRFSFLAIFNDSEVFFTVPKHPMSILNYLSVSGFSVKTINFGAKKRKKNI